VATAPVDVTAGPGQRGSGAQWMDPSSAEALLFTARRLLAEPVALLFAAREVPAFAAPGLADVPLAGLDPAAGVELAARAGMAPRPAAELVALTAGNPLALLELPARLTERQRSGQAPLDQPPHGGLVDAVFLAQARELDAATHTASSACDHARN
jgi:hypothetical protein